LDFGALRHEGKHELPAGQGKGGWGGQTRR